MDQINALLVEIRPGVELVALLSSVIIAVVAIIGLKQIVILKKTLRVQSKRDALKLTSEQCAVYMAEIIPLQDEFQNAVRENNVKYFEGWDTEVREGKVFVSRKQPPNSEGLEKVILKLSMLNNMESFSSFFTSNVGDERVAYNTVGTTFLTFTRGLLPWVLHCNQRGYYKSLTQLFIQWESRRLSEEIREKKESLEEQLRRTTFKNYPPVGTEIK